MVSLRGPKLKIFAAVLAVIALAAGVYMMFFESRGLVKTTATIINIERTHNTADGRQTLVSLTRKGAALQEKAKDVPACLTERMRGMCVSGNDLTAFAATLDTLITQLKP